MLRTAPACHVTGTTNKERVHGSRLRDPCPHGSRSGTHMLPAGQLALTFVQGDMVEYNQCQAMLKNLYDLGITGKEEEFTAYRILMLIHGRNRSGVSPAVLSASRHSLSALLARRFESLRRSANAQAEVGTSGEARPDCSTSSCDGQLPLSL